MLGINALKLIINTFKNVNTVISCMYLIACFMLFVIASVLSGKFLKLNLFFLFQVMLTS